MAKLVVVGGARGVVPKPIDIDEIFKKRYDPKKRLTTSPFGLTPEQLEKGVKVLYVGKAVPWKGLHGAKFTEEARKHIGKKGVGLLEGLRQAVAISKAYAGVKGVGIDPETGTYMPMKAIKQKNWKAEKASEVEEIKRSIRFPGE